MPAVAGKEVGPATVGVDRGDRAVGDVGRWNAEPCSDGYTDPPITNAEGKDCDVFHGDYTGLAVGSDNRIDIVCTGLNRGAVSAQIDAYTGRPHDGYAETPCSHAADLTTDPRVDGFRRRTRPHAWQTVYRYFTR